MWFLVSLVYQLLVNILTFDMFMFLRFELVSTLVPS